MLELARDYVPGAEAVQRLRLPEDPLPSADAIVAVGHPLSYLDDAEQLDRSLIAIARALKSGGVLAFDICDYQWGEARRDQQPRVWFGEDWVLITVTSVPDRATYRREMTMFVRSAGELWYRDDELHDNVLVDANELLTTLARNGVTAEVKGAFGDETLPYGLAAIVGHRVD
jgi:hypothetical protein